MLTPEQIQNLKIFLPLFICLFKEPYELHHPDYLLEKIWRATSEGDRAFNMLSRDNKLRLLAYLKNPKWKLNIEDFYSNEELKEILGINL